MISDKIASNIEIWKKKLLDMSMRNRMLNYKDSKNTLIISTPSATSLYDRLVNNDETLSFSTLAYEEQMSFDYDSNPFKENDEQSEDTDPGIIEFPGDITATINVKDTIRALKYLRNKAKTVNEEQGVNILFLSFGFLDWKETVYSKDSLQSPLVLVPVMLSIDGLLDPYKLSILDDEIVSNPTLAYKLETEFGVSLPSFDSSTDSLDDYFDKVRSSVKSFGWSVSEKVTLSCLSFNRINMYKDLQRRSEIIAVNPIVKAISGEEYASDVDFTVIKDYDHDSKSTPETVFQVVDADSSQQDAILLSKQGASFVLQGPPGTGKSQTITNIIAEALASGKKVLFVSEKMAALEVVYKRLAMAGLSDFCLVLHSNKANKKELLDSLHKVSTLNNIRITESAHFALSELKEKREKLNKYVKELHTKIEPFGKSIFEVNGLLAELDSVPDILFDLEREIIKGTSSEQYYSICLKVEELAKAKGKLSEDYERNTWKNCVLTSINHEMRHDISAKLQRVIDDVSAFELELTELFLSLDLKQSYSYATLSEIAKLMEKCIEEEAFPAEWLSCPPDAIEEYKRNAVTYKTRYKKEKDDRDSVCLMFSEDVFNLDAGQIISAINNEVQEISGALNAEHATKGFVIDNYKNIYENVLKAKERLSELNDIVSVVVDELQCEYPRSFEDYQMMISLMNYASIDYRAAKEWFETDENGFNRIIGALNEAENDISMLIRARDTVLTEYDKEVLDVDCQAMISRFRTEYTSAFRLFNKQYKEDCNALRACRKTPIKKISNEEALSVLNNIRAYKDLQEALQKSEEKYRSVLGSHYEGEATDFKALRELTEAFKWFARHYNFSFPEKLKESVISGSLTGKYLRKAARVAEILKDNHLEYFYKVINQDILAHKGDLTELISCADKLRICSENLVELIDKVRSHCITNDDLRSQLTLFNTLEEYQSMRKEDEQREAELKAKYLYLYEDLNTDWVKIKERIEWAQKLIGFKDEFGLSAGVLNSVATKDKTDQLQKISALIRAMISKTEEDINWFDSLFSDREVISCYNPKSIVSKAQRCIEHLEELETWIDFNKSMDECKKYKLEGFVNSVNESSISTNMILPSFKKRFFRLWLDAAMVDNPEIAGFRKGKQNDLIDAFRRLDNEQMVIAKQRIRAKLIDSIPDIDSFSSAQDEVAILRREMGKQRKIMPVRKLFESIPNLLPQLKPCLMMSPLSVSAFLQSENYHFDMVIFDEASQVKTENAIGAISRGAQVIIAGDIHQLPPTSFFASSISNEEEFDEEDDSDAFDSVLDVSRTVLPQTTLRWHYRSRNEALIAFSNAKIYNSDLVTFPSPTDALESEGVQFIYVEDGIYGRSGKRNNPVEAKRVVDEIFDQIQKYPDRSLGVITFSEAQQQCVEDELFARRLMNPQYEEFFFEDKEEPFFIKNLENVQGDERDTIIFSVGYGKSAPSGELHMNFGPLSKEGGYRRLNVAITRAKYSIKLIGSFLPTDMRLSDVTPRGVKLLHDYIEFAQNGVSTLESEITYNDSYNTESPFEEAVLRVLSDHGYNVRTQVGCSGYRIDMAIEHPTLRGRFVLGIECDGATYHSSRTARERDRLRQQVLESMGWKMYRIWSTDWIKDPRTEAENLLKVVDDAIKNYEEPKAKKIEHNKANEESQYVVEEEKKKNVAVNQYGFSLYREPRLPQVFYTRDDTLAEDLDEVIKTHYPMHYYLVCKLLAPLQGNEKVTNKIRDYASNIIKNYCDKYGWKMRGMYLWPKSAQKIIPRVPAPNADPRSIEYVAKEELAEAMCVIIDRSFGIDVEGLYKVIAREYGWQKVTEKVRGYLDDAFELVMLSGVVQEREGKLSIKEK